MQTDEHEMTDGQPFELEQFLPYRLSILTNTISQGIAARYRDEHDISVTEWRILAVLGQYPGLTASKVVERTAMDKVAIHRAVKTLEAKRLLERRTDKNDRRRRQLFITSDRGQDVLQNVIPRAKYFERKLLEALGASERKSFFDILEKLHQQAAFLKKT